MYVNISKRHKNNHAFFKMRSKNHNAVALQPVNPLSAPPNRGQLGSSIGFCVRFAATCAVAELHDENLASPRNVAGKGRSGLMGFADNYGYLL